MAKSLFINNVFQGLDNDGDPRANGFVYFYRAGTSSPKDVFSDSSFLVALANPVPLDANGRAEIWMDGAYKVKVTDDDAFSNPITTDDVNIEIETATDERILLINGSFEFESEVAGLPDNWIVIESADGTIEVDSTDQAHGFNSLKFTSIGSNGAGTAYSDRFNVMKTEPLDVNFIYKASAADTYNKIDFRWYDAGSILLSSSNAYTNNSTNPTSYEERTGQVTAHASAVQADILITGMDGTGATNIGSSWFDGMSVRQGIHADNIVSNLTGDVTGDVNGDVTGDLTGNADTADRWSSTRSFTMSGDVTGFNAGFDGSANISITTTIEQNTVDGGMLNDMTAGNEVISKAIRLRINAVGGYGTWTKGWECRSGQDGSVRVGFTHAVVTMYSSIWRNGVMVSGEIYGSGAKTYDLIVSAGDLIQIYSNCSSDSCVGNYVQEPWIGINTGVGVVGDWKAVLTASTF